MLVFTSASSQASSSRATFPFPGPAPVVSSRERYFRALERERDAIIAASSSHHKSPATTPSAGAATLDFGAWSVSNLQPSRFDDHGRQVNFKESVQDRQRRLEFLRRQEYARRRALGLSAPTANIDLENRWRKPSPAARTKAAIKIQRTYRSHLARLHLSSAISTLATKFDSLRHSHLQNSLSTPSSPSEPSSVRRDRALREYSDRLRLLQQELASLGSEDADVDISSKKILRSQIDDEIRVVQERRLHVLSPRHKQPALPVIEEEVEALTHSSSAVASGPLHRDIRPSTQPQKAARKPLRRAPTLTSIVEMHTELSM